MSRKVEVLEELKSAVADNDIQPMLVSILKALIYLVERQDDYPTLFTTVAAQRQEI